MSIWVRSQDKLCLMRVDALPIINHDEVERIWSIIGIGKFQYKLGTYKSKERALEVLDEIQTYLENNYLSINDMPQHNNGLIANGIVLFPNNTQKVYQMPEV